MKTWHWVLAVVGVWYVFVHKDTKNLGGSEPKTIWEKIQSGQIHLPS